MQHQTELAEKGYTVITAMTQEEAYSFRDDFEKWRNVLSEDGKTELDQIHGIIKSYGIGQAEFMWNIRKHDGILNAFRNLVGTNDLITSFDGAGYYPLSNKPSKLNPVNWAHRDQCNKYVGLQTIQGVLYLEDSISEDDGGFVCWEGSHLYAVPDSKSDFVRVTDGRITQENKLVVRGKAGTLVLWDSRLIHANTPPTVNATRARVCAYICMADRKKATKSILEKRIKYYHANRTTSHHPYRVHVNTDSLMMFHKGLDPKTVMVNLPERNDESDLFLV